MDAKYPSAPELPGKHTGHYDLEPETPVEQTADEPVVPSGKIQLIESTKPKADEDEPEDEAPVDDDDEVVELDDEDELNEHVDEPGDPDGVVADDQIKQWQQEHPLPAAAPKKHLPFLLKALIVLLVIAALTAGAWWYGGKKAEAPATSTPKTSQTKPKTSQPAASTTKHYSSAIYTLEFDYPESWTVSDTAAKLTITSPSMQLVSTNGQKVEGQVVVAFQNPQTTIAGYPAQGAVAALTSTKLTYKKPTSIQRAQTYVSYVGYTDNNLNAVYVTGDNGYQAGQLIPMSDVVKGNPLIGVTFMNCGTAGCSTGGSALSLRPAAWTTSDAAKAITALLESLQLD